MGVELGKCSAACRGLGRSAKYRESPGLNLAYLGSLENRGKFVGRSIGLAEHTDPKVQLASPGVGPEPAIDGEERIGRCLPRRGGACQATKKGGEIPHLAPVQASHHVNSHQQENFGREQAQIPQERR
jgi:hypothetical protein